MAHKQKAAEERNRNAQDSAPVVAGAMDPDALRQKIQVRAYYRYCERGCALGADLDDWLAAEQEVLATHADAAPR